MSYEKQTWVTGETITQEKLNHMEDGIEEADNNRALIVGFSKYDPDEEEYTLNKTWGEIRDASLTGPVILVDNYNDYSGVSEVMVFYRLYSWCVYENGQYAGKMGVYFDGFMGNLEFFADGVDDFPRYPVSGK